MDRIRVWYFGNKNNVGFVQSGDWVDASEKRLSGKVNGIMNNIPILVVKDARKTIRSWGFNLKNPTVW